MNDINFIRQTLKLARQSGEYKQDTFAALLVKEGEMKAQTMDQCLNYSDPTAHTELTLISEYCRQNNLINLGGYTLYSSTEPCVMWSGANPKPSCEVLINVGGKKIQVIGPVLPELGSQLLEDFPIVLKKKGYENRKSG